MDEKTRMRLVFGAMLLVFVVLSGFIIRPYIGAIASGILLGYIFHPLNSRLLRRLKRPNLTAAIVTILVVLVVLIPSTAVVKGAVGQAQAAYVVLADRLKGQQPLAPDGTCDADAESLSCRINRAYSGLLADENFRRFVNASLDKLYLGIWNFASSLVFAVPRFVLNFIIALLVMFAVLVDGEKMVGKLRELVPLGKRDERVMFDRVHSTVHALIFGHILGALAQAAVGTIGLIIIGVDAPLFWGSLMAVTALIPFVGAAFVWIPLGLGLILTGAALRGIIYLVWGFLVISTVDNLIRTVVVSERTRMSLVVIFLGVVGGVSVFGVPGFIFGPLILTVTMTVLELYPEDHTRQE